MAQAERRDFSDLRPTAEFHLCTRAENVHPAHGGTGPLKPSELSFAPFGFVAWHLLPYYLAHEGKDSADLGGFGIYVDHDAVDVQIDPVSRREAVAIRQGNDGRDAAHPFSEIHPRGWFGYARFTLEHSSKRKPADIAIDWKEYSYPVFPLNDAEWRELANSKKRL